MKLVLYSKSFVYSVLFVWSLLRAQSSCCWDAAQAPA
ncbi:hypothetical protein TUN205_00691 [Pyrenophora tritici-repentis]|nr:hypothetical protein TUN205_00691 [Pyrenophora tritici-repentis]